MLDRVSQFALVAAAQAMRRGRSYFDDRAADVPACSSAPAWAARKRPTTVIRRFTGRLRSRQAVQRVDGDEQRGGVRIGIEYGLRGPNLTFSTACSSSAVAIGEAARRIAAGEVDVMIAGGSEAPLILGTLVAWQALRTLADTDAGRPGAAASRSRANRTGLVLGEGAAILVLEDRERALARGARLLAELVGYGLGTDATHMTRRPRRPGGCDAPRVVVSRHAAPTKSATSMRTAPPRSPTMPSSPRR